MYIFLNTWYILQYAVYFIWIFQIGEVCMCLVRLVNCYDLRLVHPCPSRTGQLMEVKEGCHLYIRQSFENIQSSKSSNSGNKNWPRNTTLPFWKISNKTPKGADELKFLRHDDLTLFLLEISRTRLGERRALGDSRNSDVGDWLMFFNGGNWWQNQQETDGFLSGMHCMSSFLDFLVPGL